MKPLLIRADASPTIGTGHVMRCLALAQAWQDAGGHVTFLSTEVPRLLRERLNGENLPVSVLAEPCGSMADARHTANLAEEIDCEWVVVDGYGFGAEYQRELKHAGLKVFCVDDNPLAGPYVADIVLNQNLHAKEEDYGERASYTRLLLGPRYALLRREFFAWRQWRRIVAPTAQKVLLSMGGSDPDNVTSRMMCFLNEIGTPLEIRVVVGPSNHHADMLMRVLKKSRHHAELVANPNEMAAHMAWADLGIVGAGSTVWELCLLGLPALLVELADNQCYVGPSLQRLGAVRHLGRGTGLSREEFKAAITEVLCTFPLRQEMSARARDVVDGYGSERAKVFFEDDVRLRRANHGDCELVWKWANDPITRTASFASEPIAWNDHVKWFQRQVDGTDAILYIAEKNGMPLGQVRFRIEAIEATVSISLNPTSRGQGLGWTILTLAVEELFSEKTVARVNAFVKPENERSLRLFPRAGFKDQGQTSIDGKIARYFVLERHRGID